MDNIREHVEMPLIKRITDVMFCAHDEEQHTVRWSHAGKGWMVENPTVGLVDDHIYGSLGLALHRMEQLTGGNASLFTITDQP